MKQLEAVVDQTSFDSLDTWLKARLEDFLEQDLITHPSQLTGTTSGRSRQSNEPALSSEFGPYANTNFADKFKPQSPGSFADWANLIAPTSGNLGNSLVSLSVSLPASASGAWIKAPDNQADPAYKKMSIALQRQFKQVMPDTFFNDLSNFNNVSGDNTARAVVAFCSIPPCSDADLVQDGDKVPFLNETAAARRFIGITWIAA